MYAAVVVVALAVHVVVVLVPLMSVRRAHRALRVLPRGVGRAAARILDGIVERDAAGQHGAARDQAWRLRMSIVSFMLPAGATLNKNGAAVYKAVTAVFIAQLYGVPLGPSVIITIVLTSMVAAFAGPGVPGSSLVTTLIVLNAIGLGTHASAAIALVVGIDRPLDMCRTTVNTIGNLVGAAVVARSEGEALTA